MIKSFEKLMKTFEKDELKRKKYKMSKDHWFMWSELKTKAFVILLWVIMGTVIHFIGGQLIITFMIMLLAFSYIWWIEIMFFKPLQKNITKVGQYFEDRKELEDTCPKCHMPRKSICDIECYCVSLKNGHISQKEYDKHIKLRGQRK